MTEYDRLSSSPWPVRQALLEESRVASLRVGVAEDSRIEDLLRRGRSLNARQHTVLERVGDAVLVERTPAAQGYDGSEDADDREFHTAFDAAWAATAAGDLRSAQRHYGRAVAFARRGGEGSGLGACLMLLGTICLKRGMTALAANYIAEAIPILRAFPENGECFIVHATTYLGVALAKLHQHPSAETTLLAAISLSVRLRQHRNIDAAMRWLAIVYFETDRVELAEEWQQRRVEFAQWSFPPGDPDRVQALEDHIKFLRVIGRVREAKDLEFEVRKEKGAMLPQFGGQVGGDAA